MPRLAGVHEEGRRAGGREGGGDLAPHMAGLAHASDDHAAAGVVDQRDGPRKGVAKTVANGCRERRNPLGLGIEGAQRRRDQQAALTRDILVAQHSGLRHRALSVRSLQESPPISMKSGPGPPPGPHLSPTSQGQRPINHSRFISINQTAARAAAARILSVFGGGFGARAPARLLTPLGVGALLFALAATHGAALEPLTPSGMRSTLDDSDPAARLRAIRQPVKKSTTDRASPASRFGSMVGPSAGKTGFVSTNVKSKSRSKTKGKRAAAASGLAPDLPPPLALTPTL